MQGPSRKRRKNENLPVFAQDDEKKNEISSEGIAQLIRSLIRRCQLPAHNTIPHTPEGHRNMKTSHREGDTSVGRWREKRHREGTQEEKWITVRGRLDWRIGGLGEPICRPASVPLARQAREAKRSTNAFPSDHTQTLILILRKRKPGRFRDNFVTTMQMSGVTSSIRHSR